MNLDPPDGVSVRRQRGLNTEHAQARLAWRKKKVHDAGPTVKNRSGGVATKATTFADRLPPRDLGEVHIPRTKLSGYNLSPGPGRRATLDYALFLICTDQKAQVAVFSWTYPAGKAG